jgi:hypothetical protein
VQNERRENANQASGSRWHAKIITQSKKREMWNFITFSVLNPHKKANGNRSRGAHTYPVILLEKSCTMHFWNSNSEQNSFFETSFSKIQKALEMGREIHFGFSKISCLKNLQSPDGIHGNDAPRSCASFERPTQTVRATPIQQTPSPAPVAGLEQNRDLCTSWKHTSRSKSEFLRPPLDFSRKNLAHGRVACPDWEYFFSRNCLYRISIVKHAKNTLNQNFTKQYSSNFQSQTFKRCASKMRNFLDY